MTYDIITPESAEDGEAAERGYCDEHGTCWPVWPDDQLGETVPEMTLREALSITGRSLSDGGNSTSFYAEGEELDYRTGDCTTYALHAPRTITRASARRLARVLRCIQ